MKFRNQYRIFKLSFPLALSLALVGCASSETKSIEQTTAAHAEPTTGHPTTGNTLQTKFVAAEQGAQATAELIFAKSSARLPKDADKKIKKALQEASAHGRVSEVKIVAWADQEYPSTHKDKLPASEQKLASDRAAAVEELLKKRLANAAMEKISMAERPGALDDFFKTSDFRVKRSLERAGIPNENTSVKVPAMERKALVLFLTEDSKANE